jgi:hypothetical protein
MTIPKFDNPEFDAILAEAWENANKYSYEGPWGVRIRGNSDKAVVANLVAESREMRVRLLVYKAIELLLAEMEAS